MIIHKIKKINFVIFYNDLCIPLNSNKEWSYQPSITITHIPCFSIQFLLHWLLYYSLIWSTSSDSVPLKSEYLPWILQFVLLILHFLLLDTLSPTPIPVLSFSVLFSWSHGHPDVPHEYLSVPIQYSISLMMKPDRKLWKQSVWNCNIIVIRNVLNRLNRLKAGKKITPVNSKYSQEFLFGTVLAPLVWFFVF